MRSSPEIVSYEWCGKSYSSVQEVWEAKEKSSLVAIVGNELCGLITRHWSDGETDTVMNPRIITVSVRS